MTQDETCCDYNDNSTLSIFNGNPTNPQFFNLSLLLNNNNNFFNNRLSSTCFLGLRALCQQGH